MTQRTRVLILVIALVSFLGGFAQVFAGGGREVTPQRERFTMYWNSNHRYDIYQQVIDDFAEEHNLDIDIQTYLWPDMRTKLLTDFSGGTVPDLIQVPAPWIAEFAASGLMLDLSDRISQWPDSTDWFESTWVEVSVDNRRFGIKNHHTTFGMFYNKEIFRQAGLDPESPPRTLSEFRNVLETIANTVGPDVLGFAFDQDAGYLVNFFASENTPFLIENGRIAINTPEIAESLQVLQDIAANGWTLIAEPGASYQTARRAFFEGSVAMMLSGPWDLATLANDVPDLDFGIAPPPSLGGIEPRTMVAGTAIGIPADARHADLAWELTTRLTDLDVLIAATLEAGMLMPRRSWAEDPRVQAESGVADFAQIIPFARPFDIEAASLGISDLTWSGGGGDLTTVLYQNIIYNRQPAAAALADYVREGNRLLQQRQ